MDADHRVPTDPDPRQHRDLSPDPDVVLDHHRLRPAGPLPIDGRFGVGEMVSDLAGAEHAVSTDLNPLGGDDRAAVPAGTAANADDRLATGGDEPGQTCGRPTLSDR